MTEIKEVAAEDVEADGFARFNAGTHATIDVPDGYYTLSCRTSTGKLITMAFVPYTEGGAGECVDVQVHDAVGDSTDDDKDSPAQRVICFSAGGTPFSSKKFNERAAKDAKSLGPVTLTTHILSGLAVTR